MIEKLRQLTKETVIYGISTILGRFLNFILVPFYTNIFIPEEYGIITNVYALIAILNVVFLYGLDSSYLKFATEVDLKDKKLVFSVPTITILVSTSIISMLIIFVQEPIMGFLSIGTDYSFVILLSLLILVFDTLAVIPFLYLRLENRAVLFTIIKVSNIVINVALNIVLIVGFKWGIEGVFVSNLAASLFSLMCVLPIYRKLFVFRFDKRIFRRFIRFGLPYLPAGLASIFIQVIDRPIVEQLTDLNQLGIYQANYKLGIFMMLFVSMFQFAWQPFFLKNAKDPHAKELFAKVFTYFTITGSLILVTLSLFIDDIVRISILGRHLIGTAYWSGNNIVPIVLLGYLFNGFHVIFSAGLYIKEKSDSVPVIMGISAIVNIGANFLLIPVWGITGAAAATLASYIVMAAGYYIVSQKLYFIKYEVLKILKLAISIGCIGILYYIVIPEESINSLTKGLMTFLFILLLILTGVISKKEYEGFKTFIKR